MLIYILFIWTVVSGIFRKWLVPSLAEYLFYVLHLITLFVYIKVGARNFLRFPLPGAFKVLLISSVLCALTSAITSPVSNLAVTTLGFINYFFFVPMCVVVLFYFRSVDSFIGFLKFCTLVSIPVLALGFIQYFSPVSSPINKYVSDDVAIAVVGERARITATFSYLGTYSPYLLFMFSSCLILAYQKIDFFRKCLILAGLGGALFANALMTGSRGTVWTMMINVTIFFGMFLPYYFRSSAFLKRLFIIIVSVAAIFYIVNTNEYVREAKENFMSRVEKSKDVSMRMTKVFQSYRFFDSAGFFGFGIGMTYGPSARFIKSYGNMPTFSEAEYEEDPNRVFVEVGLLGYISTILLRAFTFLYGIWLFFNLKYKHIKAIVLGAAVFQLAYIHRAQLAHNASASLFYWFCTGVIFAAPYWQKQMKDRA